MTTATSTPADVLADIQRRLDALGDQADALNTANAQAKWAADQSQLVNWRNAIHTSTATLAKVEPKIAADEQWEKDLAIWREQLTAELDAGPVRIRNERELGVQQNLKTSIRIIDHGKRCDGEWTRELESLRLGDLLRAAGYEPAPSEAANHIGPLPWFGSLADVRRRLRELRAQRNEAQMLLDDALRDATS